MVSIALVVTVGIACFLAGIIMGFVGGVLITAQGAEVVRRREREAVEEGLASLGQTTGDCIPDKV